MTSHPAERETPHALRVVIAGRTILVDAPSLVPEGRAYVDYATGKILEQAVALRVAELGLKSGPALRFLRRAVGLRLVDVSELLGEPEATIVAWEREELPLPQAVWLSLAALVASSTGATVSPRDLAAAIDRGDSQPKILLVTIE